MRHVLKRAVGLDQHLVVDYADGSLLPRDFFLICSDGVWQALGDRHIQELMLLHDDPQGAATRWQAVTVVLAVVNLLLLYLLLVR